MELLALTNTDRFLKAQEAYFDRQNIKFTPFLDAGQLNQCQGLVLFIPIECQGQFVSPDEIWRYFLAKHYPDLQFILAGVEHIQHHNYLDLLHLPSSFSAFFHNLKPTSYNEWTPFSTEAMDMREKLHRFYEGHGDESVTFSLGKISRKMETLAKRLKQVSYPQAWKEIFEPLEGETTAYTEEKWKELHRRWGHYAPFFQYLPFRKDMEEVGRRIVFLSPFFENNCRDEKLFESLDCKVNIDWIRETLDTIKSEYVP